MIKAGELVIGNIVKNSLTGYVELTAELLWPLIKYESQPNYEGLKEYYERHSFVLLTEEWLVKFGLKLINLSKEQSHLENVVGNYVGGRNKFYYVIDSANDDHGGYIYIDKEIQYVHELQNIYFILTGKKLKLN